MGKNKAEGQETDQARKKTTSVQCELYEAQDILSFIGDALYDTAQEVYSEFDKETGARLSAMGFILRDIEARLHRITEADVAVDLEIAV